MGFAQILADWRDAAGDAAADHAETALATFRVAHPQVYGNLDGDMHIHESLRQELLRQLVIASSVDREAVTNRVVSFCQAHQCIGPRRAEAERDCLGHVVERERFEKALGSTAVPTSGLRRRGRTLGPVVDEILRRDLAGQRGLLRGVFLSPYVMWSFYDAQCPATPFQGISKHADELVRRLGLGLVHARHDLLVWAYRLRPPQTAHVPTAFDAGLHKCFRPGGKTQPLAGSGAMDEVVHAPIVGGQLEDRIETAIR
jgi:hypothetical protein